MGLAQGGDGKSGLSSVQTLEGGNKIKREREREIETETERERKIERETDLIYALNLWTFSNCL